MATKGRNLQHMQQQLPQRTSGALDRVWSNDGPVQKFSRHSPQGTWDKYIEGLSLVRGCDFWMILLFQTHRKKPETWLTMVSHGIMRNTLNLLMIS